MAAKGMLWSNEEERHLSLFQNADLFNAEEWLLQLNLAKLQKEKGAKKIIDKAKEIMTSGLLPDVTDLRFASKKRGQSFDNFIEFETDFGWIRLRDLGYGYQTMLAWVLDLVRRMFERYPESPNPIREPSIVLVDEIDLHLHPEWQRKIISHLTKYFPNTQFIVTAHSPLVVQSAERINLVLLDKEGDHVTIRQPKIPTYQGWSLEEILTELMGLGERTHSEKYLELIRQFETALDGENYESAQTAYDELDKILHPQSHQRKLLRLQMSSLTPA
jgi:predicted ATP-binding protein involved in virulence